jgi:hypothetical protein
MRVSSFSNGFSSFPALEAAYLETQVDLAPQASAYAMAAARAAAIEAEDEDVLCGTYGRRYFDQPDNGRFDMGFWGATRKGGVRTHCSAKSKRTMIRKRGRV